MDCDRPEAYERNENFGNALDTGDGPVFRMDLPPLDSYKDINTDLQVYVTLVIV